MLLLILGPVPAGHRLRPLHGRHAPLGLRRGHRAVQAVPVRGVQGKRQQLPHTARLPAAMRAAAAQAAAAARGAHGSDGGKSSLKMLWEN